MPVGGIKMKVLAGHRAGLDTIILPRKNERDLDDLPDDVRKEMKFLLVEHMDEALNAALMPGKGQEPICRCPVDARSEREHLAA